MQQVLLKVWENQLIHCQSDIWLLRREYAAFILSLHKVNQQLTYLRARLAGASCMSMEVNVD